MNPDAPLVSTEVTFLSQSDGGRRSVPPLPWGSYMPHAVVVGTSEYLGVRFVDGPQPRVSVPDIFVLSLMHHPRVDYSALIPGAQFTLREGGTIVATGRVVSWHDSTPADA